jgi:hypothetical protein
MSHKHQLYLVMVLFLSLFQAASAVPAPSFAQQAEEFVTWDDFEPDKCASIWLIRRFIAPDAQIRITSKKNPIKNGIAFDTPEAKLRRYHNRSTFETLLDEFRLTDPKLLQLGKIMHDIEINTWDRKAFAESNQIKADFRVLIDASTGSEDVIEKSVQYFDAYYERQL